MPSCVCLAIIIIIDFMPKFTAWPWYVDRTKFPLNLTDLLQAGVTIVGTA